ncbi:MAG: hypothetical protein ACFE9Y_15625 [Promethearchaeota archaeon]
MSKPERNVINFEEILTRDEKSNVLFFNYDNEAKRNFNSSFFFFILL